MKKWMCVLAGLACFIGTRPAQAQVSFGPQLAWSNDWDLGLGARAKLDLANMFGIRDGAFANLYGAASGAYFWWRSGDFPSWSLIELNSDAAVPIPIEGSVTPFVGAGLQWTRFRTSAYGVPGRGKVSESETAFGLSLLGGVEFPLFGLTSFAEAKLPLGGKQAFTLSAGVLLGGR